MGKGPADRTSLDALSTREIQVLRGLALGRSNREIAESYAISTKTVDTYRFGSEKAWAAQQRGADALRHPEPDVEP